MCNESPSRCGGEIYVAHDRSCPWRCMHIAVESAISAAADVPVQVVLKLWPRNSTVTTTDLQTELLCLFRSALHVGNHKSACRDHAPMTFAARLHTCVLTTEFCHVLCPCIVIGGTLTIACTDTC